jgi:predicted nucleic acid-binding protein
MNDNVFIDTNILIYFVSNDEPKKIIAKDILMKEATNIISSQVIGEFVSVTRKKKILPSEDIIRYAIEFMDIFDFVLIGKETIKLSFEIHRRYKFSSWDSLIIASALENECKILYSEDMQHNQLIDRKLRIVSPFV